MKLIYKLLKENKKILDLLKQFTLNKIIKYKNNFYLLKIQIRFIYINKNDISFIVYRI
jgi:hypothetical protein